MFKKLTAQELVDKQEFIDNIFQPFLLQHADKSWDWFDLSVGRWFSKTILHELNNKPWDWNLIARHPAFASPDLTGKRKRHCTDPVDISPVRVVTATRVPRKSAPYGCMCGDADCLFCGNWDALMSSESIVRDDWFFRAIPRRKEFTIAYVVDHQDLPWDWINVSEKLLTIQNYNMYPHLPWDFRYFNVARSYQPEPEEPKEPEEEEEEEDEEEEEEEDEDVVTEIFEHSTTTPR